MQDGCKVYIDSFLRGIKWVMLRGHLDYMLEIGLIQTLGDNGTPNAHNR